MTFKARSLFWPALRTRRIAQERYRCQACGARSSISRLEVHHKFPVALFPDLELDSANTVVLCNPCHENVHWCAYRPLLLQMATLIAEAATLGRGPRKFDSMPHQFPLALEAANASEFKQDEERVV